ncbi:hypothetical protein [Streptomyces sp. HB2AG]|uniref:hypothetical protein n=1 Tax=Streptomyces sp. HB2AG TaxID=2983400 RepID=UPI0022AB19F5|nr:hypothetical protein [Streptomyces sp. HB2AG]MCZ2524856.1 hypothetical protein [Streptomyces sp. HB2AG]
MNDAPRTGGYSVPSGRPHLLREVHAKLSALDDRVGALWQGADPLEFDAIADDLHAAFRSAAGLAPPRSRTGCPQHPDGAVDPEAPVGWSRCLLCNTRRRMRERVVPPPAERQNRMGYPVPEPPYTLESLNGYMRRINNLQCNLEITSPEGEFAELADLVHQAFIVARELSRPRSASGCPRHPGAPMEPVGEDAPVVPDEDRCLFCAGERRRARAQGAPTVMPRRRPGLPRISRRFPRPVLPGPAVPPERHGRPGPPPH